MKATVIISVYSNVRALNAVMCSLERQTEKDFEVIVSEDAEHKEMAEYCASYRGQLKIIHLTQVDNGWNKNHALNRAINAASTDWFIFVDGDCVLHPRFIEYHLRLRGEKNIVAGKRVKLNAELSERLMLNPESVDSLSNSCLLMALGINKKGCQFVEEGIFINPKGLFGFIPRLRSMYQLKGCNMAFSRQAAIDINGFDEDYKRPAIGEDIDLVWRFQRAGYKLVSARNLAVQYHLWHKENWSDQSENIAMMKGKQSQDLWKCKNGLIQ